VNILLVDNHRMMRDGLKAILDRAGQVVVGEAGNGYDGLSAAHRLRPDIVLMDISMPELNGVDATRRLAAEVPGSKVIALSMHADRRYVLAMFAAGAAGYLLKNSASEELLLALRAVAEGHRYVSPGIAGVLLDSLDASATAKGSGQGGSSANAKTLSPREREVLQLLAEGKSSKEIASRLAVALPTIETHRRQIMDKLELRSVAELTKYAIREGLTALDD
jgi:DNA-binding NarL/FixJ family response regulator